MSSLFVFAASREVEPFVSTLPRTLQTGIGKAAAAVAVARELATRDTRLVCLLGVAGAYGADPEVGILAE
ncbi:MAG: hypothetical protein KDB80_06975 [Planctomycetes bacterium]|nr:hypothetical protein [Planctomycetota bacterium]